MQCIAFDFEKRQERTLSRDEVVAARSTGQFVWIDLDQQADADVLRSILNEIAVDPQAIEELSGPEVDGRHDLYDDMMHIAVTSASYRDGKLLNAHVHLLLGERFLISLHPGKVDFIEVVRRIYKRDFVRFARTGGFLLYEYWDQLIEGYRKAFRNLDRRAEKVQEAILDAGNDAIFTQAADVQRDMLSLRKVMLAAREVLHDLTTRRTPFVAETTLPSLERLAGALERLVADLTVERESLAETLNLYMGIVAHRTNRVMSRLTVLSAVFLPLTFLVGVYGMNFQDIPETHWKYSYPVFWLACSVIVGGLLTFMKKRKWW